MPAISWLATDGTVRNDAISGTFDLKLAEPLTIGMVPIFGFLDADMVDILQRLLPDPRDHLQPSNWMAAQLR